MGKWNLGVEKGAQELGDMRGDARINGNLTAVTDERPLPLGSPTEGLHLLVSVVDCPRGGTVALRSFPDSFLFAYYSCLFLVVSLFFFFFFFFFFFVFFCFFLCSEYISLSHF